MYNILWTGPRLFVYAVKRCLLYGSVEVSVDDSRGFVVITTTRNSMNKYNNNNMAVNFVSFVCVVLARARRTMQSRLGTFKFTNSLRDHTPIG